MNERKNCPDCKRLVENYGEHNLEICERCGHFFKAEEGDLCPCRATHEEVKE